MEMNMNSLIIGNVVFERVAPLEEWPNSWEVKLLKRASPLPLASNLVG